MRDRMSTGILWLCIIVGAIVLILFMRTAMGQVTLRWDPPAERSETVVGYNVLRNGVKINATLVSGLEFVDSTANLDSGSVFTYCVTAEDSSGRNSVCSNAVSNWAPGSPGNLRVLEQGANFQLFWDAVPGAQGYEVWQTAQLGSGWSRVAVTDRNEWAGHNPGRRTGWLHVKAVLAGGGLSGPSNLARIGR